MMEDYLKKYTFLSKEEIESLLEKHNTEPHLRLAQKTLAKEIITFIHDEESYNSAVKISEALFSGNIKDLSDKIGDNEKEEAEAAIKEAKEAVETDDLDKMKEAKDKLNEKAMALGQKVYEEASKNNAETSTEEPKTEEDKKDDNVVDAEYEEK
jgi:tyrosyl-tRNA synthetase